MKVIIKITEMPAGDIQIDVGSEGSEAASTEELKCGAHVVRAFNICLPLTGDTAARMKGIKI